MSALTRRRALRAVAPVAGLLAAGLLVWQGSYAAFSATTTSPGNSWATGSVSLTNNTGAGNAFVQTGTAAFTATNLKPGSTGTACITVKSTGTLPGPVALYTANVTGSAVLQSNLLFTVKVMNTGVTATNVTPACAGFTATSTATTNTALSGLPTAYAGGLGGWTTTGANPEYAAYQITWTLSAAAPNTVQGTSAGADFVWEVDNS
jgi:hypothetical protein